MGPISVQMLCAPFKGKAGLASIFAKTRRLGWDVSISQMKFLRALLTPRSADVWAANHESLMTLARYSVGLTEFHARLEDLSFEQVYGLLRVFTNAQAWEEAHKGESEKPGEWLTREEASRIDPSLRKRPRSFPRLLLSSAGTLRQRKLLLQTDSGINVSQKNLTMMYHTEVTG